MNKNNRKVVLISMDALSNTELDVVLKQPNLSKLISNGTFSNQLISVYPTLTYTVHATVSTGNYPDKHKIYGNHMFQPFINDRNKEWFWYRSQIKSNTIYDAAKANGKKTAAFLWPTTCKSGIKYHFPEVVAINNENQVLKVLKNGSPLMILNMELKYGKDRESYDQPHLDKYTAKAAAHIISHKKPDLVMVHLVSIDAAKHKYRVENTKVAETVEILDQCIGEIVNACDDSYSIVLFSDHGQFSINYNVHINSLLKKHGLVDFDNKEYKAFVQSPGGSGVLHAKSSEDIKKAVKIIEENMDLLGVEAIYAREDLDRLHADKDIKCMIECKAGYNLVEGDNDDIVVDLNKQKISYATHGYDPNKEGYECLFIAVGEGIAKGKKIGKIDMVDIAPTVCSLLDIEFNDCDGRIISEIYE